MGATSFVRLRIPRTIWTLMDRLAALYPEQAKNELEWRNESAVTSPPRAPRAARLSDIRISRTAWRYVVTFCGLDTFMLAAARFGGSPALACDNHGPAQSFWQSRTGRPCLASLDSFRAETANPDVRAKILASVLVYTSGPPCVDFSRAGCGRGLDGNTGHLFLEDAEAALEVDAPIVVSEIVVGVLRDHLVHLLHQKVERLRSTYRVEWRVFRCNRHGDAYTNRRRILIVGVKPQFLLEGVASLLPTERAPAVPVGLDDILEPADSLPNDLQFNELERLVYVPSRPTADEIYDGLKIIARVDGQERIGHQVYDSSMAATIRTDGDGPGGATGLYIIGDIIRRLSPREAARTHSTDETTIGRMFQFLRENSFLDIEKESFRFIGNSIPVMALSDLLSHLLPLLRW